MAALHRAVLREGLRVRAPAGLRWPALWLLPGAGSGPDGEVAGAGEDGHVEADFGDDGGGENPVDPGDRHQLRHLRRMGCQAVGDLLVEGSDIGLVGRDAGQHVALVFGQFAGQACPWQRTGGVNQLPAFAAQIAARASPARANDCRGGLRCACGFATFGIAIQQSQCVKGPRSPYNLLYCVSGMAFDCVILATHYCLSRYILGGGRHLPAAATTSS